MNHARTTEQIRADYRQTVERRRLASIAAAAAYADVSDATIRRRIADGTIVGLRCGPKLLRVDLDEIDEKLLRRIPTVGGAA